MNLGSLKEHWTKWGEIDPYYAVVSFEDKKGGKWDQKAFFETGVQQIGNVAKDFEACGHPFGGARALDFGCGVGRLTQALGDHFEKVTGIDISETMLVKARELNKLGDRCQYILNERSDLSVLEEERFDLIFTFIVLQHMEPRYIRLYLREMANFLTRDGYLYFQLPTEPDGVGPERSGLKGALLRLTPKWALEFYRSIRLKLLNKPVMEVFGIPSDAVCELLDECGLYLIDSWDDTSAGPGWKSKRYLFTRRGKPGASSS